MNASAYQIRVLRAEIVFLSLLAIQNAMEN